MQNSKRTIWILTGVIVVLALLLVGVFAFLSNQPPQVRGPEPLVSIAPMEPDPAKWAVNYPRQYDSWLRTQEMARTAYGGSDPYQKLDADPRLKTLFAGNAFSKDYKEDRGHYWSLEDVTTTGRNPTAGTCMSCKSSDNPRLWAELTPTRFYSMPFSELKTMVNNPISCANCHEPGTMNLIVTNPALREALTAQGKDPDALSRQELRTLVCANCHVEYYFKGTGKYLTFPWANGTRIEDIEKYYDELLVDGKPFSDWTHAISGAPMIKMQHPEFEMFTADSTHYKAGVACADCHMPYQSDGATKYSSHFVASPLKYAEQACGTCHHDVQYVIDRVGAIQTQVSTTMSRTEEALVSAIQAMTDTAQLPAYDAALLDEARQLHRKSQMRWDFIAAENSMGFHNPEEALRILADAIDYARQAELKARQAAGSVPVAASELP